MSTSFTSNTNLSIDDAVIVTTPEGEIPGTFFAVNGFNGQLQVRIAPGTYRSFDPANVKAAPANTVVLATATSEVREALFTFLSGRPVGRPGAYGSTLFVGCEAGFRSVQGDDLEGVITRFCGGYADIEVAGDEADGGGTWRIVCHRVQNLTTAWAAYVEDEEAARH